MSDRENGNPQEHSTSEQHTMYGPMSPAEADASDMTLGPDTDLTGTLQGLTGEAGQVQNQPKVETLGSQWRAYLERRRKKQLEKRKAGLNRDGDLVPSRLKQTISREDVSGIKKYTKEEPQPGMPRFETFGSQWRDHQERKRQEALNPNGDLVPPHLKNPVTRDQIAGLRPGESLKDES